MTFLTPRELSDRIVAEVAQFFGVSLEQLFSAVRARQRTIVRTRAVAMWLMRAATTMSLVEIGRYFSRDHTTVSHAVQIVNDQLRSDELLRRRIQGIAEGVGVAVAMPNLAAAQ